MAVTMKDVAKEAKVSLGTVSNYINGKESVSEYNQIHIEKAIQKLGYQVNEVARNLRMSKSMTIGVVIPTFSNVFAVKIVSKLEQNFRKIGYSVYVSSYRNSQRQLTDEIRSMVGKQVDGIIIMPSRAMRAEEIQAINSLIAKNIPVVVFGEIAEGLNCDQVLMNDYKAVDELVTLLFNNGHKEIGLFLGPKKIHTSKERLRGYLDSHRSKEMYVDDKNIVYTDYSKTKSKNLCLEFLKNNPGTTAIIATSYRITLGCLAAVSELELSIPNDISIIGFDIPDIADITRNKLTGTIMPQVKIADVVSELVLKRINNDQNDFPTILEVEIEFVEGNSIKRISA